MAYQEIGKVVTGKSRKHIRVKWNTQTGKIQVDQAGLLGRGVSTLPTKASSSSQAMDMAEAYLRNE